MLRRALCLTVFAALLAASLASAVHHSKVLRKEGKISMRVSGKGTKTIHAKIKFGEPIDDMHVQILGHSAKLTGYYDKLRVKSATVSGFSCRRVSGNTFYCTLPAGSTIAAHTELTATVKLNEKVMPTLQLSIDGELGGSYLVGLETYEFT
jgi:hypothetical protein